MVKEGLLDDICADFVSNFESDTSSVFDILKYFKSKEIAEIELSREEAQLYILERIRNIK